MEPGSESEILATKFRQQKKNQVENSIGDSSEIKMFMISYDNKMMIVNLLGGVL
jgi:hypothetical protein